MNSSLHRNSGASEPPAYRSSDGFKRPVTTYDAELLAEEIEFRMQLDNLPLPRSVRLNEYTIPSDGIRWDVIDQNITNLLGEEAYLWRTYSPIEEGWYTMYATRPLTPSQINDLKLWTCLADEQDRLEAEISLKECKTAEQRREKMRDRIRRARAENETRDRERWEREKRRRTIEREIAWEERRREEWRRYWKQRVEEEEEEKAEVMSGRSEKRNYAYEEMDSHIQDGPEDEEEVSQRRRKRPSTQHTSGNERWGLVHTGIKKRRIKRPSHSFQRYDELVEIKWDVTARVTPQELLCRLLDS